MSTIDHLPPAVHALFDELASLYVREGYSTGFRQNPALEGVPSAPYRELVRAGLMELVDGWYKWSEAGLKLVLEVHPMSPKAAALLSEIKGKYRPGHKFGGLLDYTHNELVVRGRLKKGEADQYVLLA